MSAEPKATSVDETNPSQQYRSPDELANDTTRTVEQRVALLEQWKRNILGLMVADGEGMTGATRIEQQRASDLQSISESLDRLGAKTRSTNAQSDIFGSGATGHSNDTD